MDSRHVLPSIAASLTVGDGSNPPTVPSTAAVVGAEFQIGNCDGELVVSFPSNMNFTLHLYYILQDNDKAIPDDSMSGLTRIETFIPTRQA